ncbi:DUF664 domain-containing protein [Amycolatopsis sp. NPDC101161]|uniref:mycothiol transferase n=1 Tax=Amycolatopsis sp. NPDC101161 TaxID=3363940 RepID=UPI0037FFB301
MSAKLPNTTDKNRPPRCAPAVEVPGRGRREEHPAVLPARPARRGPGDPRRPRRRRAEHRVLPSGWTPLGMVEHLGYAERHWFQEVVTGAADPVSWPDDDHEPSPRRRCPRRRRRPPR